MKHYDYLIVGLGLAGVAFCEQLQKSNRSFVVFEDSSQQSSKVAAGLYNPTVLKRFTVAWRGPELMMKSIPMYRELEKKTANSNRFTALYLEKTQQRIRSKQLVSSF